MLGDEPPYLSVGTEVSAKYKGAFCEAKVRKVDRTVKCKVTFKLNLGTHTVSDTNVKGTLRVGATVEAKHPEKKEYLEGSIVKIQDCSQYTVVFDDGDITTLRRSALCLKSGRHFAESETLDQLPLTHPEHFGNPVVGGRRGRRRQADDSSGDEETPKKGKQKEEKEADIGKVVCVELGDKKKMKDNWFPGLVVAPTAQDTVRIRVKEEYLVRSFKDGRYYTVPKKEATEFTREIGSKVDNNTLKTAVEKALYFLDRDELPPHWDRDLLFGLIDSDEDTDTDGGLDSDSSDDEPREEKDHFVAQLYKFMDDNATPINNCPSINGKDLDLYKLFKVVHKMNGYNRVDNHNQWKIVAVKMNLVITSTIVAQVKQAYKKYLHSFEDFYRKLGCTMVSHPRNNHARNRSGRRLIRDKDRATPVNSVSNYPGGGSPRSEVTGDSFNDAMIQQAVSSLKEEKDKVAGDTDEKEVSVAEPAPAGPSEVIAASPPPPAVVKPVRGRPPKREPTTDDVYESEEDSVSSSESAPVMTTRPRTMVKKFPTLKASPRVKDECGGSGVKLREKRKTSPVGVSDKKVVVKRPKMSCVSGDEEIVGRERRGSKQDVKNAGDGDNKDKGVKSGKEITTEKKIQHTRSRSKESFGLQSKKETAERRASSKTSEGDVKKPAGALKKRAETAEEAGQQKKSGAGGGNGSGGVSGVGSTSSNNSGGRKRRNTDTGGRPQPGDVTEEDLNLPCLASFKSVLVGDIVKVYYGPPGESKVIYEAKVVDVETDDNGQQIYLVHYAGWNSRYDEWVKRNKIADNLSWVPARGSRRAKLTPLKTLKSTAKRRPFPNKVIDSCGSGAGPRSTTPSSVTSSSSRTKSPAMTSRATSGRRVTRNNAEQRAKLARSESESEDDTSASDTDNKTTSGDKKEERTKKEGKRTNSKVGLAVRERSRRRRRGGRVDTDEEDEDEDNDEEDNDEDDGEKSDVTADDESEEVTERRRKVKKTMTAVEKKTKKKQPATGKKKSTAEVKSAVTKHEDEDEEEDNGDSDAKTRLEPKGRDFDLNIIRSELKGIEKAVDTVADEKEKVVKPEVVKVIDDLVEECAVQQAVVSKTEVKEVKHEESDDVYEFKEPEPFEFEVRPKLGSPEDRNKSNRRGLARIFDEVIDRSPEKMATTTATTVTAPVAAQAKKPPLTPTRLLTNSPDKKEQSRFRNTIGKKVKEIVSGEKVESVVDKKNVGVVSCDVTVKEPSPVRPAQASSPVNLSKTKAAATTELPEIPVLKVETIPSTSSTTTSSAMVQQQEQAASVTTPDVHPDTEPVVDPNKQREDSSEPPCLLPMTSSMFPTLTDKKESPVLVKITDKKDDEDPISAAIQRVIAQASEEDSDNLDMFSNKPITTTTATVTSLPMIETNNLVFRSVSSTSVNRTDEFADNVKKSAISAAKKLPPSTATPSTVVSSVFKSEVSARKVCSKRNNIIYKKLMLTRDDDEESNNTSDDNEGVSDVSDSSSGEERLVIANDDDDSMSDDNLSLQCLATAAGGGYQTSSAGDERKKKKIGRIDERVVTSSFTMPEELMVMMPPEDEKKADVEEENESSLRSLLCEETIPGSPGPSSDAVRDVSDMPPYSTTNTTAPAAPVVTATTTTSSATTTNNNPHLPTCRSNNENIAPPFHRPPVVVSRRDPSDAAVVMDNTPPTTPESNLSSISGSPREERVGSSSLDNESSKSHRDSSEVDLDHDDHRRMRTNMKVHESNAGASVANKEHESPLSKRKRASRKRREKKLRRHSVSRSMGKMNTESDEDDDDDEQDDEDDTSESSRLGRRRSISTDPLLTSPRPSKYQFYGELDPDLDASQRIAVLQQKLQDLRKCYMDVKSQLSVIDRRRKKLRRRDREEKAAAAAAALAAAVSAAKSSTPLTTTIITTTTAVAPAETANSSTISTPNESSQP